MRSLVAGGCETLDTVHKTDVLRRNNSTREEKSLYTQLNLYSMASIVPDCISLLTAAVISDRSLSPHRNMSFMRNERIDATADHE